jgi:1-deoxy-D-xylulose-5-phosphate synthase
MQGVFTILSGIHSPSDLKKIPENQLPVLAKEIRKTIIEVVAENGGHLASNLGVVELTIALHRVFDSPVDAFVWDVSHQCYAHKLLTGRYERFSTLRKKNGISGFTRKMESPHDYFDNGHASTSISQALGLLTAWDLMKRPGKVVAIIGDGALTGGMAFEALSHAGQIAKNLIVILNDNQMSISKNTGSLSRYLSRLTMTDTYQNFRHTIDRFVDRIPYAQNHLGKMIFRLKRGLKGMFLSNNLFVDLGFEYVGPLNGHDIEELETVLRRVKRLPRPVVVHVVTRKGRGYSPAENDPSAFHGIGPFCISDGTVEKFDTLSFTQSFCDTLMKTAARVPNIAAVTAAMSKGTGLDSFSRHYPARFFDVGIAEEHAVTFAGGLAAGGLIPVVAIYSTFIQRAIDQIIHDVALPRAHVIFVIDRAGAVPGDGETHQGIFDIALLRPIPHMVILCPVSAADLSLCFDYAVKQAGPVVIRYPKASCPSEFPSFSLPVETGRGILLRCNEFAPSLGSLFDVPHQRISIKILFVCTGGIYSEVLQAARSLLLENVYTDIYCLRFISPVDEEYFVSVARQYTAVLFVEDGVEIGGVSQSLQNILYREKIKKTSIKAFPSEFFAQGTSSQIHECAGLSATELARVALDLIRT